MGAMNVLVSGGAGYVGSHTVLALLGAGHRVAVLDDLSTGHRDAAPPETRFFRIDLLDAGAVRDVLREGGFDAVVHFAAKALVEESMRRPELYFQSNIVATLNLLEAVRLSATRRIVFSSSCAVYGVPTEVPIPETHPLAPANPYGFTKAVVERMLEEYRRAHGLGYAALRYFNAAGADPQGRAGEKHDPETHLIPRVLRAASGAGEPVTVCGSDYPTPDGTCVRDYVHVADLAAAHLLALDKVSPGTGETLNVGTGKGYSVLEVIRAARDVVGREIPFVVGPRRPGDPPILVGRTDRIRSRWGWNPRWSDLPTIVDTAWKWHR